MSSGQPRRSLAGRITGMVQGWSSALLPLVLALFALCLANIVNIQSLQAFAMFEIRMAVSEDGIAQLFYDVGRGINESDSVSFVVDAGAPAIHRVGIPAGTYRGWRFDPLNRDGRITIYSAAFKDAAGRTIRVLRPDEFQPLHQISPPVTAVEGIEFHTIPNANDPMLGIASTTPLSLQPPHWIRALHVVLWCAGPALLILLLAWAAQARWVGALRAAAATHPQSTIFGAAILSVLVQMHPVVFAGRSLVSPENGPAWMLYDRLPTLPGYVHDESDWVFSSDVGAVMWEAVPLSNLQHDALFDDGEFPLWNRYSFAGVPLLGQGISMFGNPGQFLAVAFDGSAWAWDVHYVVARILFAAGIGLAAWRYGAGLAGACLGALVVAFIGFFGFRFNHMAGFSVCYAPWILVGWAGIRNARSRRALLPDIAILVATTVALMTSGTIKESFMLLGVLHLAGALAVLTATAPFRTRAVKLAIAAAAGVATVLLTAPLWLTFLRTLAQSATAYDLPRAFQIEIWKLAGFFDDILYRRFTPNEAHFNPAVSFALLFGLGWALAGAGEVFRHRAWRTLAMVALLPFGIVFGLIPAGLLTKTPFIRNIISTDNTFSCVLIVLTGVLACFGWQRFLGGLGQPLPTKTWIRFLVGLAVLFGVYFAFAHQAPASPFYWAYVPTLLAAATVFPFLAQLAWARGRAIAGTAALMAGVFLCLWRFGEYIDTPLDQYVANPGTRIDLNPPSPALTAIQRDLATEPWRIHGLGQNLFAGYHQARRVETVYGVSPLRNPEYQEITTLFGMARLRDIVGIQDREQEVLEMQRSRDFLNVRYYLGSRASVPRSIPGLKTLGQYDLHVFESPTAWPRAFFTDAVLPYDNVQQFIRLVNEGDGRPFAAMRRQDLSSPPAVPQTPALLPTRVVNPGREYLLTTNTTSFTVDASSAGLIVLGETYYPDDFRVRLNGVPAGYVRVNHAFKGIVVNGPGTYRVTFTYWPHYFTATLIAAGIGALLLGVLLVSLGRSKQPV